MAASPASVLPGGPERKEATRAHARLWTLDCLSRRSLAKADGLWTLERIGHRPKERVVQRKCSARPSVRKSTPPTPRASDAEQITPPRWRCAIERRSCGA